MNTTIQNRNNEQGVALVTTLLFLSVMSLLSTTLVFTVQNEVRSSSAYKYNQQAFYISNAGIQKTVNWFRNTYTPLIDPIRDDTGLLTNTGAENYTRDQGLVLYNNAPVILAGQTGTTASFPNNSDTYMPAFASTFNNSTLSANEKNAGVYAVNATLLKYTEATFINPATFESYPSAMERWRINSLGYWGNINNPIGAVHIEATIENSGNALFDKALWGIDSVDLGGTVLVDSYDPALGNYDVSTNRGNEGSVGSNGSVSASGTVDIYGDMAYGPEGSYDSGPNITVTGTVSQLPAERVFPPIPDFTIDPLSPDVSPKSATVTIGPGTYGTFDIKNNGILKLEPGVYYVDTITQAALGTLEITGDTTIFVKSGLDLSGQGVINPNGDPTEMTIYYDGTSEAKFTGGSSAYMEVYAPDAPVKLTGNADFFGSFIGKTLALDGTPQVHFSLGCLNDNLVQQPFRVLSWSQKSF